MTPFDQTPDKPEGFGYKASWFAVKASDSALAVDALEFAEAAQANWKSGVAAEHLHGTAKNSGPSS